MDEGIINSQVGDYLITERIKAGGMAIVYKAADAQGHPVALKLLQSSWSEHEDVKDRFEREARIMSTLNHPHIVKFRDYGLYKGRPYIVMDYLEGGSLAERLRQVATIELRGTAGLLRQIASALDYAHGKGIVHRDLKPGNILFKDDATASLTDFGIARVLEHTQITVAGQMPGTPQYMSPEQARGGFELNQLSDQYSLGVIAFLLSTGVLPFTGSDPMIILNLHLTQIPPVPSQVNPALPEALDAVLLRVLEKDPARRYATVTQFANAYLKAVEKHGDLQVTIVSKSGLPPVPPPDMPLIISSDATVIAHEPTYGAVPRERLQAGGANRLTLAVAIAAVLIVVVLAVLLLRGGDADETVPTLLAAQNDGPTSTPFVITPTSDATRTREAQQQLAAGSQTAAAASTATQRANETAATGLAINQAATAAAAETGLARTQAANALTVTAQAVATASQQAISNQTATALANSTATAQTAANQTVTAQAAALATANANLARLTQTARVSPPPLPSPSLPPPVRPYENDLDGVLADLLDVNRVGTAARFDCRLFSDIFAFLEEQQHIPEFAPVRPLIDDPEDPMRVIYDDYCQRGAVTGTIRIDPVELYQDMRSAILQVQENLP